MEEDSVDRISIKPFESESLHVHLQSHAKHAVEDKLSSSTTACLSRSGSLIITESSSSSCNNNDSYTNENSYESDTFHKIKGPPVPVGLKVIAMLSMVTAIILISASGILLSKTHETLVKWLNAAPTTMALLGQVNDLLGGTTGIVEEVQSQEKYLKILITCSAVLVITGTVQLLCNIWFFCRMNAPCVRRCLVKSEQFFCGI